jgi:hypothetical protein
LAASFAFLKIPNERYIYLLVRFYFAASLNKSKTKSMKVLNIFIASVILSIAILSCKKNTEETIVPTTPPVTAGSFIWKENGVAYTADSAYYSLCCTPTVTTVFAYKGAGVARRFFEINITTSTNGSFTIPASGFNPCALYYSVGTAGGQANGGGTIAITNYDNANNKVSGTFSAMQGANTLTEGVFNGLPKK